MPWKPARVWPPAKAPTIPTYQALMALTAYIEGAFPNTHPGYLARHRIALVMLSDKNGDLQKREQNVQEALLRLRNLDPKYSGILLARYQLAENALRAESDKMAPPMIDGKPVPYRQLAVEAAGSHPRRSER